MWRRTVELTTEQREELAWIVRHHPEPYVRERASAVLEVAAGEVAARVAAHGLLVPRDPDTVYGWLDRFGEHGVAGLTIAPGRGRKPRLSPRASAGPAEAGPAGLLELLASDPRESGQDRTRWTLAALRAAVPTFGGASLSGVWRVLARAALRWKRARDHVRSPDPASRAKLARLATPRAHVDDAPLGAALLYLDEMTYSRRPSLAAAYAPAGRADPRAERSGRGNTPTRVLGALDAHSGRVLARQRARIDVPALVRFFEALVAAYPGRRLYVVLDHWPVHFHPDGLAALEPQRSPFPFLRPRSWPTEPSPRARRLGLPIQLVPLPTYAPWANPIEKLWRRLKQDVLHLHRHADDLPALRARVRAFLDRFTDGSADLLRYVGLHVPT